MYNKYPRHRMMRAGLPFVGASFKWYSAAIFIKRLYTLVGAPHEGEEQSESKDCDGSIQYRSHPEGVELAIL